MIIRRITLIYSTVYAMEMVTQMYCLVLMKVNSRWFSQAIFVNYKVRVGPPKAFQCISGIPDAFHFCM